MATKKNKLKKPTKQKSPTNYHQQKIPLIHKQQVPFVILVILGALREKTILR